VQKKQEDITQEKKEKKGARPTIGGKERKLHTLRGKNKKEGRDPNSSTTRKILGGRKGETTPSFLISQGMKKREKESLFHPHHRGERWRRRCVHQGKKEEKDNIPPSSSSQDAQKRGRRGFRLFFKKTRKKEEKKKKGPTYTPSLHHEGGGGEAPSPPMAQEEKGNRCMPFHKEKKGNF